MAKLTVTNGGLILLTFIISSHNVISCPQKCFCGSSSVDCSFKGFTAVPLGIASNTRTLDLQGNNITEIRKGDFTGLKQLRELALLDNNLAAIESGAFDELISLTKLNLNRNKLREIPKYLFSKTGELRKLDISNNFMFGLQESTLSGLTLLTDLHLDNNGIACVEDRVFRDVPRVQMLSLNGNNFTRLPLGVFDNMNELRILRLANNIFECDCNIAWLARWLKANNHLARFTRCSTPAELSGVHLSDLPQSFYKCEESDINNDPRVCPAPANEPCPDQCSCRNGRVDCKSVSLTAVPNGIPTNTVELRLERNSITKLSARDFEGLDQLRTLDLSFNQISEIDERTFQHLRNLRSLVLYTNRLETIPSTIFKPLTQLTQLWLNSNKIKCIHKDTFSGLHNLNLLALFDNEINTIVNSTFDGLDNLQTLHIALNPYHCDCDLYWLADYLDKKEVSGAASPLCKTPATFRDDQISNVLSLKSRCGNWRTDASLATCQSCPSQCRCTETKVDCSNKNLVSVPSNIPPGTIELDLSGNSLTELQSRGFIHLNSLRKLDLSNNQIRQISENAFVGLDNLAELQLTGNRVKNVRNSMFNGLPLLRKLMLRDNQLSCLDNQTLTNLPNLRLLSLYGNRITCLQSGAFNSLRQLSTLNLISNPLNCDCHMKWFAEWLHTRQNRVTNQLAVGSPSCTQPYNLKGSALNTVSVESLRCEETSSANGCRLTVPECCTSDVPVETCHPPSICPDGCECEGTRVMCTKKGLTEIPSNIPPETTHLDLSENRIQGIKAKQFSNLTKLTALILSGNKIKCIQQDSFANLRELKVLNLYNNDISTIPFNSFRDLVSLNNVVLGENPLWCDCNLKWLAEWIKIDYRETGVAKCEGPENVRGNLLLMLSSTSLQCRENYDASNILAKCNACVSSPCENEATCVSNEFESYQCMCKAGYYGDHCQYEIDACFGNPCENNGRCSAENGRIKCTCQPGYEGVRCQTNIDDCADHACENGATCIDQIETYQCRCPLGFAGKHCEEKRDLCTEISPCNNGATCANNDEGYTCSCVTGFTDKNCSTNIDDCVGNICQNGGACKDGVGQYTCECESGFTGKFCEVQRQEKDQFLRSSVCQNSDCQNGGVCFQPADSNEYECRCTPGYEGKNCEKLTSLSFAKDSFVQMSGIDFSDSVNLTILFSTDAEKGILFYQGDSGHIAAELFQGRVRVSFHLGNDPTPFTMFSYQTVNDGRTHKLSLIVNRNSVSMGLDSFANQQINDNGAREFLETNPLYFGGVPLDMKSNIVNSYFVRNDDSYIGCILAVYKDDQKMDFGSRGVQTTKIHPGCLEKRNPCDTNLCDHGRCVPNSDTNDYTCSCRNGYTGTICDQAPISCKSENFKEYHMDEQTGCRSRGKVKLKRCVGPATCQPRNYRTKKIRMECDDGRRYEKSIEIVRKCTRSRRRRV